MEGHFSEKKVPAATYPQVRGFQKYGVHFPTPPDLPKAHGRPKYPKTMFVNPPELFTHLGGVLCQQRRFPLRKYFIPGCIGRGLDLDLRVLPQATQAAASGNLEVCPLGIEVEKRVFQTLWLITGQKFQGVGLKLTVFLLTFRDPSSHSCQKVMKVAES